MWGLLLYDPADAKSKIIFCSHLFPPLGKPLIMKYTGEDVWGIASLLIRASILSSRISAYR
jgi:hypothetical protein